ncbi:MAG: formate dehydrogenase subunit delta [Alteromonadaceae bacterium]|nr:formate dehydrogenase subunit delta [Alteromonadaceae bacterium]
MSDNPSTNVVEMANQIAINLSHGKTQNQCVIDITSHIQRFWAPSMRQQLIKAVAEGELEIHELVAIAITQLTDYSK